MINPTSLPPQLRGCAKAEDAVGSDFSAKLMREAADELERLYRLRDELHAGLEEIDCKLQRLLKR